MTEFEQLIADIDKRITDSPAERVKEEFRILIISIAKFAAQEDPSILQKGQDESALMRKFFKMISSIALDAVVPWKEKELQQKVNGLMQIWPIIQKYGNVQ
ncbi:MAG TPA: hypothetical protein VEB40_01040 [Flavipsychrobacter sp.]|nr:hypothetical protein [Flavipsychrobacter sp.]